MPALLRRGERGNVQNGRLPQNAVDAILDERLHGRFSQSGDLTELGSLFRSDFQDEAGRVFFHVIPSDIDCTALVAHYKTSRYNKVYGMYKVAHQKANL